MDTSIKDKFMYDKNGLKRSLKEMVYPVILSLSRIQRVQDRNRRSVSETISTKSGMNGIYCTINAKSQLYTRR